MTHRLKVKIGDRWYTVEVEDLGADPVRVLVDGSPVQVDIGQFPALEPPRVSGAVKMPEPQLVPTRAPSAVKAFRSPMPGVIVSVAVKEGDQVVTGDEVCVLEAMKMEQSLKADWTGIVRSVHVVPGQQMRDGDLIVELE